MSNLQDLQAQALKAKEVLMALEQQVAKVQAEEKKERIKELKDLMVSYGVTQYELFGTGSAHTGDTKPGRQKGAKSGPVAAKYKGPNGETWSGRGQMPNFMRTMMASNSLTEAQVREKCLIEQAS